MELEMEWRIPWPSDWSRERTVKAAEKIAEYMRDGTFYETTRRLKANKIEVVQLRQDSDPFIRLTLEG